MIDLLLGNGCKGRKNKIGIKWSLWNQERRELKKVVASTIKCQWAYIQNAGKTRWVSNPRKHLHYPIELQLSSFQYSLPNFIPNVDALFRIMSYSGNWVVFFLSVLLKWRNISLTQGSIVQVRCLIAMLPNCQLPIGNSEGLRPRGSLETFFHCPVESFRIFTEKGNGGLCGWVSDLR